MRALSFLPAYSLLSAISSNLSALIQTDSYRDENLMHGEQARLVLFSVLWTPFTKEETLGQA